jgi:hypothetical protein
MTYAIVQQELVVPDVERLVRAFCTLPGLTAIDAQNAAHDAYGILIRGLNDEQAGALEAALTHEGIAVEVVPETELPALAPARILRQVEVRADHLVTIDPLQRVAEIPWNEVLLICAGQVRVRETRRVLSAAEEPVFQPEGGSTSRLRDEEHTRLLIDLVLSDRATRLSVAEDDFNFGHLGPRLSDDPAVNHLFLVQDLEEHAPHASLNQGAFRACQKPPELFTYPSRQAYQEELTWMLWRIGRLAAEASAEALEAARRAGPKPPA